MAQAPSGALATLDAPGWCGELGLRGVFSHGKVQV